MVTKEGRFPCWDCTLKHLGIAAMCLSKVGRVRLDEGIERTRIFYSEMKNGYPDHRWLAAGMLGLIEIYTSTFDNEDIRKVRKVIMETDEVPNFEFLYASLAENKIPTHLLIPCTSAVMKANLQEALAECPDIEVAAEITDWLLDNQNQPPRIMEWIFKIAAQRDTFRKEQDCAI